MSDRSLVFVCVKDYNTPKSYSFYAQNSDEIFGSLKGIRVHQLVWKTVDFGGNERSVADLNYAHIVLSDAVEFRADVLPLLDYWQAREAYKMSEGIYSPLPAKVTQKVSLDPSHFVHIPTEKHDDLTMVSYTESADKGRRDKQTVVRLGRYLNKYHPALTPEQVQEIVKDYRAYRTPESFTLEIARDIETINEIFETKMSARDGDGYISCMYGKFQDWDNRPYHVYANLLDVAIAYVRDVNGEIIARSIVSTAKKAYVRVYAAMHRDNRELSGIERESLCSNFANILAESGYSEGNLIDCKIRKVKNDNGRILAPYLDHYSHVKKDGNDFFVVVDSDSYDYDFSGTGGYPNRCQPEEGREYDYACANCNFGTDDSSDLTETEDGDLCSDCIPGYIEAIQNSSGGTIYCHESNTREDCDGTVYTQWYADSNLTYLDGEYHTSDCPHLETECANCEYRTTDADNDLEDGLCSDCMETHNAEIERKEYEREHQTMLAY